MIRYSEAGEQAGAKFLGDRPRPIAAYYAYKNGVATKFNTVDEAREVSKLVETVITNQAEIDAWTAKRAAVEGKAFDIWFAALRSEYSYLSDEVFNLCYAKAYADGHSSGHDEVTNYMIAVVDFVEKIIEAVE